MQIPNQTTWCKIGTVNQNACTVNQGQLLLHDTLHKERHVFSESVWLLHLWAFKLLGSTTMSTHILYIFPP